MVRIRGVLVSLLVVASACTTSDTAPTTSVGASPTTTAADTTTMEPVTTTTAAAPAPTSTAAPDQVGSREVMLEEMRAAWEANQFTYDWAFEDAYIPDLQNPDPLVALEELIVFADWLAMNGGNDLWWDVITVQDSPAYSFWQEVLRTAPGRVFVEPEGGAPFEIQELRAASQGELATVPDSVLSTAPANSIVLHYRGQDPDGALIVFAPTGEQDGVFEPYMVDRRIVVLSPTDSGWAYYWGDW